ncbi:MAG: rRNA maturation RNase YbeY [bacterium]|nr:rRNA maturation RNase YbeY [bacterium]
MYDHIKNDILGKKYSLSLAFVGEKKSREINKKYRGKDKSTNVLSFAFEKDEGEILLCKPVIRKEAKNFDRTYQEFLEYLVIHGMLHLKGMQHGSIMERVEEFYCKKYQEKHKKKYDKKHFNRDRRGVLHDSGRGGRVSKRRKKS